MDSTPLYRNTRPNPNPNVFVFVKETSLFDSVLVCGIRTLPNVSKDYEAIHLFNKRKDGDDRLWSAMIPGYAHYGNTDRENETFDKMQRAKVTLNEVTFLGLLSAFSHVALWHRGRRRCVILAYQGSLLFFDEDFKTGM
ncbi:hypothetical protein YC2023_023833 [Brassica napus]